MEEMTHSTSGNYRSRFAKYLNNYREAVEALPPPPEPPAPGAAGAKSQKTALTRSARYNDPASRQSVNPTTKK